jgi:DNA mismatch endonuclease (patch repair protein)
MMAGIKGENSRPELLVRPLLFALGYRFRLHRRNLVGSPDIVVPVFSIHAASVAYERLGVG